MSKGRRRARSRKAERPQGELLEAVVAARSDLLAAVMKAGFGVPGSLLEQDRVGLCGQRRAYRSAGRFQQ